MNPDGSATSCVFKFREKDNGGLSVDVKSKTTASKSVGNVDSFMLFELANQVVLDANLQTFHDPIDENEAHAIILGMLLEDDILPGLLARSAKRVYF
jgi:hypothetical protein